METEHEPVMRQFDELIKTLIVLSSSADQQKYICGSGCPGDDMASDFDTNYTHTRHLYIEHNLLTPKQLDLLDNLDRYLENRSGQWNAEFWQNPDLLSSHADWEVIRVLANSCLLELGKNHLYLEVFHDIENTSDPEGNLLVIQRTQMNLVEKKGTQ